MASGTESTFSTNPALPRPPLKMSALAIASFQRAETALDRLAVGWPGEEFRHRHTVACAGPVAARR